MAADLDHERFWPAWRGPHSSGAAPKASPPTTWSEQKNVRWKIELPGEGSNSPIVWGDRVYVQAAIRTEKKGEPAPPPAQGQRGGFGGGPRPEHVYQFVILAYERRTGREVWRHVAREEQPHEGSHRDGSLAPSSAVTDGRQLFAYFGSRGLYCFDMNGKLQWERDLGDMKTRNGFGEGASPALSDDSVVLTWDHEGDSFITALDRTTGAPRWKKDRDEATSWATPLIIDTKSGRQVVAPGTKAVRAYDLATGEEVWQCRGLTANCIPSPVAHGPLLIVMSGFRGQAALAIRPDAARGDITDGASVVWKFSEATPYVPSPLLFGNELYFLDNNKAILTCLNAATGEVHYKQQRLEGASGGIYASPVGAGDHVYLPARDGTTFVLKRGPRFEIVATNKLDDGFDASPALVDGELYLRGEKHLYCIAED
ncbi:MAG: hypothetical protein C4547_07760 [Phycisphaerales bacterium]|nr:MAG: hypothetical protein C4547_07760 [Phycisphaerales bacterium]